jgi:hypothetical protein
VIAAELSVIIRSAIDFRPRDPNVLLPNLFLRTQYRNYAFMVS